MPVFIVMYCFVKQQALQLPAKRTLVALACGYQPTSKPTLHRKLHGSSPLPRLWIHRPCPAVSSSCEHIRAGRLLDIPSLDIKSLQTSSLRYQLPQVQHQHRSINVLRSSGLPDASPLVRLCLSLSASQQPRAAMGQRVAHYLLPSSLFGHCSTGKRHYRHRSAKTASQCSRTGTTFDAMN